MRDHAVEPAIRAKVVNQRPGSLGRKATAFIRRQNRIPDLTL